MQRFFTVFLAVFLFLFPVVSSAMTYAEYLAEQGYSQDEIDAAVAAALEDVPDPVLDPEEGEGEVAVASTVYIDNTQILDSGASVQVEALTVYSDNVMFSLPEENTYPAGAALSGGVYMQADTAELGELMIYVPVTAQFKSFAFASDTQAPVNITASSISGYSYASQDYSVRWSSFGRAQYRPVNGTGSYSDLNITSILNTNIVFVEGPEDLPVVPDANMLQIIVVFLLGVMVVCLFMKRL